MKYKKGVMPISRITPIFNIVMVLLLHKNFPHPGGSFCSLFIPAKSCSLVFHILHDLFCKCDGICVYIHC